MDELLESRESDTVLDAGCGEGFYLGSLTKKVGFAACGIDISIPAIDTAARRYTACTWIVGNADRFIPLADSSFSKLLSITARTNPVEFRRVLKPGGMLLLALPAPDDLIELRGAGRDRTVRSLAEFDSQFALVAQRRATTSATLDSASVDDVLKSIYRPMQTEAPKAMTVTFSLDLLLLRRI